ncbi:MAG: hypothetical protein ACI4QC_00755 [Thermoguttaceae bacterium]
MLPSVVANEVSAGVESYLRAAFPIGSPWFSTLWDDFFSRSDVLFKGPYYSVQLPFRQGGADYKFPSGMTLGFSPYLHQRKAFDRLCKGDGGSALIATAACGRDFMC